MKTDGAVKLAQSKQAASLDLCFLIGSETAAWVQGHDGVWQINPSREKQPMATSFSKNFSLDLLFQETITVNVPYSIFLNTKYESLP